MGTSSINDPQPFDALDHDWALLCRKHRRSRTITTWAQTEPALAHVRRLADVIPATGADRAPIAAAVARLHAAGDDLAARALLQLLVPGLIRLAAVWRNRLPGGVREAGWEVITRATFYIDRLRHNNIGCAPAGYVLRSIHRDLTLDAKTEQRHATAKVALSPGVESEHGDRLVVASPEDTICTRAAIQHALDDATRAGIIAADAVELLHLILTGQSVPDAAAQTGHPLSTAYRHRARATTHLQHQLNTDTGGEGAVR